MNVQVVPVDPYDPILGLLVPGLVQRIMEHSTRLFPEAEPEKIARNVMIGLYARDPKIKVLAVIKDGKQLVGHAVASLQTDDARVWATISQLRADGNVGDAMKQIVQHVDDWGRRYGAKHVVLVSGNGEKGFEDDMAFRSVRRNKVREIPEGKPAA